MARVSTGVFLEARGATIYVTDRAGRAIFLLRCAISRTPAFTDEDERKFLEANRWPDGPVCPFCGQLGTVKSVNGPSMGPGWYYCSECRDKFTVRVGTLYERSHIPLHKWLFATHLMAASKKGMSALQLSRMLRITYKSAWFMYHRIREGMTPAKRGPIGGQGRTVESDETMIGSKKKNRAYAKKEPKKQTVLTLVDRNGDSHSFHVAKVKAKTLREAIVKTVDRKSHLVTDENHSANEYVRLGGFAHVNTAESRFSLMKPCSAHTILSAKRIFRATSLNGISNGTPASCEMGNVRPLHSRVSRASG
jgi:transposase-like protein